MAGKGSEIKIKKEYVILLVILLLGAFVRFDGILREQPVQYHPDTWVIVGNAEKFANFDFTYNRPYSWPAATLIHFYGIMFLFTKMFFPLTEYFAIRAVQIGNALIGTLSILMVFIVGRKMFNTRTALIASLLFSVMMDHMILSRYETANSWAMFLMLLALYFMYKFGFDRKEQTDAQQDSSFKVSGSGLKINKDLL
ncbi:MAG: glycosyltransferase family 39 protein, partial [Candidatus Woesearchaeota archaeon]|nr:glycosyltransferase family 39 protein [Candidatus Woesearchaeota archaeon]